MLFAVVLAVLLTFPRTSTGIAGPCQDKPEGSLWPHLKNPSWYFECLHGIGQLLICPHLETFDVSLQKCDKYPKTSSTSPAITSTTTTPHPLKPTTTTGSPIDHLPPQWRPPAPAQPAPIQCACQDTPEPTYHRNSRHCDQYYMCYRSRPLPMSCCPGHHWLQAERQCVPAHRSLCLESPSSAPHCPATGRHLLPHPTQCSQFYYCEAGQPSRQQCPPFFGWDCRQQKCVIRSQAQCITSVPQWERVQFYGSE